MVAEDKNTLEVHYSLGLMDGDKHLFIPLFALSQDCAPKSSFLPVHSHSFLHDPD